MSLIQYRYRLKVGSDPYVVVSPRYSDSVSFNTTQEDGQMFFREKLEAALIFQRADFDLINNAPFETEFLIELQENINGVWTTIIVSKFYKTDLTVDVDNKTIEVTPISFDDYEAVVNGLDKEFNLIELNPPTVQVNFVIQPVFQIVAIPMSGSTSVLTNLLGGTFFEQEITGTLSIHSLLFQYSFGPIGDFGIMLSQQGLDPDISGEYVDEDLTPTAPKYRRKDGVYRMQIQNLGGGSYRWIVVRVSSGTTVYRAQINAGLDTAVFTSLINGIPTKFKKVLVYGRLLTNATTVGATPTSTIPTSDIVSSHGNYTRVVAIGKNTATYGTSWQNTIYASDDNSFDPDRWGRFPSDAYLFPDRYYLSPTGDSNDSIYPLARSEWGDASFWWEYDAVLRAFQESGAKQVSIKHAYKLSDVINVLLTAAGAGCDHQDASDYSEFLYAASNAIRGTKKTIVIAPKSNVLVGEYTQPAQKAPIRLSEVLALLRYFHNAYWHIADSKFRIEHIDWYENGGQYSTPNIGTDLTTQLEPRTGLGWGYRTSKYTYDKAKLPERKEYSWMDKVSGAFEGYPIVVNSAYVEKGNIEQNQITQFTSDIDFFNVAQDDISKNGFVFFECIEDAGELNVPFVIVTPSPNETYKLQNGYASFIYAHDTYHKHGLPAPDVNINRFDTTAESTIRSKVQEVELALSDAIDPYELVTTNLGTGRVKSIEKNLSNKAYKIVILHDTE